MTVSLNQQASEIITFCCVLVDGMDATDQLHPYAVIVAGIIFGKLVGAVHPDANVMIVAGAVGNACVGRATNDSASVIRMDARLQRSFGSSYISCVTEKPYSIDCNSKIVLENVVRMVCVDGSLTVNEGTLQLNVLGVRR